MIDWRLPEFCVLEDTGSWLGIPPPSSFSCKNSPHAPSLYYHELLETRFISYALGTLYSPCPLGFSRNLPSFLWHPGSSPSVTYSHRDPHFSPHKCHSEDRKWISLAMTGALEVFADLLATSNTSATPYPTQATHSSPVSSPLIEKTHKHTEKESLLQGHHPWSSVLRTPLTTTFSPRWFCSFTPTFMVSKESSHS